MLHEFIASNSEEILALARSRIAARSAPRATDKELEQGVPLFLRQLGESLRLSSPSQETGGEAIGKSAAEHGAALLQMGFTVAQVIQDYGDVCRAVTELASATSAPISAAEHGTLNRCADEAIAGAVTEYTRQRERSIAHEESERLGALAHELRNHLYAAMMAFDVLKTGNVAVGGSVGNVLGRSLNALRDLIDRSLVEVRLKSPLERRERVSVSAFIEEVEVDASLRANAHGIALSVASVEPGVDIEVDRQILAAAVINLLQNAFKFSHARGHVSLTASVIADRVLIEVQDECGGLPAGKLDGLFHPFEQRSANRSGLGLGLSISQRGVEANGGLIRVRDLPGTGCVFTIDLPRMGPARER